MGRESSHRRLRRGDGFEDVEFVEFSIIHRLYTLLSASLAQFA